MLNEIYVSLKPLGFSKYSVSNYGNVRNDEVNRLMLQSGNQSGTLYVGLIDDNDQLQRKLSVGLLVAKMFLNERPDPNDNVIHLDGNRKNNFVTNLEYRPGWFAKQYHRQFDAPSPKIKVPIIEFYTDEWFPDSWAACRKYGLLDKDVLLSVVDAITVWPTGQLFVFAPEY